MIIQLPDESLVRLDRATLRFYTVDKATLPVNMPEMQESVKVPFELNCELLAGYLSRPLHKFSDCFRRFNDYPSYSARYSKVSFDLRFLPSVYNFPGSYRGGTFCSADIRWNFLDGGIHEHLGYGWGSHSYSLVKGTEALRAVCLFFGIKQPMKINGETSRRPLAALLQEMTHVPLTDPKRYPNVPL